jgi:hypothetical protein
MSGLSGFPGSRGGWRNYDPVFRAPHNRRTRCRRRPFWTPFGLQKLGFPCCDGYKSMRNLVGLPGFEPGTSCTPSKRASQAAPQPDRKSFYHKGFGDMAEFRQDFQNALSIPNCYQVLGIFLNPFRNPVGDGARKSQYQKYSPRPPHFAAGLVLWAGVGATEFVHVEGN